MKSRLINDNSKLNSERNDVQQIRRGGPNWNTLRFKLSGSSKQKVKNQGLTGSEIFKKENYQKKDK